MSQNKNVAETQFQDRIEKVRLRFIAKLSETMRITAAGLPGFAGDASAAVETVAAAYRRFHDIAGIGSAIGFAATGQAARTIDAILIGPFRDQRGLRSDEVLELNNSLEAFQTAALTEIQPKD